MHLTWYLSANALQHITVTNTVSKYVTFHLTALVRMTNSLMCNLKRNLSFDIQYFTSLVFVQVIFFYETWYLVICDSSDLGKAR